MWAVLTVAAHMAALLFARMIQAAPGALTALRITNIQAARQDVLPMDYA
jgi:hypothetical protein